MPRELPGFYWDVSRNRYFPMTSKRQENTPPAHLPPSSSTSIHGASAALPATSALSQNRKRRRFAASQDVSVRHSFECLRLATLHPHRQRCVHDIMSAHIASTSRLTPTSIPLHDYGSITSFCVKFHSIYRTARRWFNRYCSDFPRRQMSTLDNQTYKMVGDSQGWVYSMNTREDDDGVDTDPFHSPAPRWAEELNLVSEISAVCMSGTRCISTSFGPSSKILVQDMTTTDAFILNPGDKLFHDIWTACLHDRSLTLGVAKKAVRLRDVDTARGFETLDTQSDVFAVRQHRDLVYTGARNGTIARFDTRTDTRKGQMLLDDRSSGRTNTPPVTQNSIMNLHVIKEWQLLFAAINGDLQLHDLRFLRSRTDPLLPLRGHVNSYATTLALAVDPSEDYCFAAGQDGRIRAWSLKTGALLVPPQPQFKMRASDLDLTDLDATNPNPFLRTFDGPVRAMQVTGSETDPRKLSLWVAQGRHLYQWHLGQRAP